jgi:YbbR domain-containing protein
MTLRWISKNFLTFLWAFFLSVAVWVAAVTSADPDETRPLSFSVSLKVIGQDPSLVINSPLPQEVNVVLRAPRSVWETIEADPASVQAILDLSGLSAGEHTLDLQIQVKARPVQIVSVSPSLVAFTLDALEAKTFGVDLSLMGEPAVGYQVGDPAIDPQRIIVAGARSQVQKVERVRVSVNLNGIRENFDQTLRVEVLDSDGQRLDGLTVSPDSVRVNLPVSQQGGYRDVAVKVNTQGRVASGYRLTDISVFPPVVTVFAANPELVSALPGVVDTQPLDLQNEKQDISVRVALNLPPGISVVGEQTVLVQVGVSPIESSVTLAGEKVEAVNLSGGLTAQVSPSTIDVIVSGPLPLLDTLTRQDVRVTADLSGMTPGKYQVAVRVEVLIADIVVESILPTTVEVVIAPAAAPTP